MPGTGNTTFTTQTLFRIVVAQNPKEHVQHKERVVQFQVVLNAGNRQYNFVEDKKHLFMPESATLVSDAGNRQCKFVGTETLLPYILVLKLASCTRISPVNLAV